MIRYALFPGHVVSKRDGQIHNVGAAQLAQLYGVDPKDCTVIRPPVGDDCRDGWIACMNEARRAGLLYLAPRYDGDYDITKALPC